ncbi:MAG: hypothetical protein KDH20_21695 [Rhodocyclaceae bacterium]|nr:hypothetical protein [Rhodocyclaceae bacterium]
MVWIACLLLVAGCATGPSDVGDEDEPPQTLWPKPPTQPRFEFVTMLQGISDIRVPTEEQRLKQRLTGVDELKGKAYHTPSAVASRAGRVYVADTLQNAIVVFDIPRRRIFTFGRREPNSVQRPQSLAIDGGGLVYVLDTLLKSVLVFDSLGLHLKTFKLEDDVVKPVDVAVNKEGTQVYVVDRGSLRGDDHKILVYGADGTRLSILGSRGREPGQFDIPLAACVHTDGTLAVLDAGNFRVQLFDQNGEFIREFGSAGTGPGNFSRPRGLAIDETGLLYVSDAKFNNFQVFNQEGELLMAIGGMKLRGGPGEYALLGRMGADELGHVFVTDLFFRKVEVYRRLSDEEGQALVARSNGT